MQYGDHAVHAARSLEVLHHEGPARSTHARTGQAQWLSETVATFGLVLTILLGIRHRPAAIPALVASYIFAAYWFTASTSFANPAVTLARSLTQTFAGIRPEDASLFVASQFVGALAGLAIARLIERPVSSGIASNEQETA